MKALTLRHPWPYAVAFLGKDVENRTWKPGRFILIKGDWFAIHGGKSPKGDAWTEASDDLRRIRMMIPGVEVPPLIDIILPGIVAVCRYGGFVKSSGSPWFSGPFGWVLDEVVPMPRPIPCKGSQGLWDLPPEVLLEARRGYAATMRTGELGAV